MQQHAGMTLGQERHKERATAIAGMMETYLIGKDRLAGTRRTLDQINAVLEKAALQNCIQPGYAAGDPRRKPIALVRVHPIQSVCSGSATVNVEPAPSLLMTEMFPSIASTSCLVIHKPPPTPPVVLPSTL